MPQDSEKYMSEDQSGTDIEKNADRKIFIPGGTILSDLDSFDVVPPTSHIAVFHQFWRSYSMTLLLFIRHVENISLWCLFRLF